LSGKTAKEALLLLLLAGLKPEPGSLAMIIVEDEEVNRDALALASREPNGDGRAGT
jgi:hypothetical protein